MSVLPTPDSPALSSNGPKPAIVNAPTSKSFNIFSKLPAEIRLKIWAYACFVPRTIDVWTDFKRCDVDNTIFYCQIYLVELAPLPPPCLLSVSREARGEALKHYSLEFLVFMNPAPGIEATMPAKWYVNWDCDIFVPTGYWNLVSFADFVTRSLENRMKRVAIDVSGVFWKENLRDYVLAKDCWALNGVEEVVLYDPRQDEIWKGSEYLHKFRRRNKDGPKVLSFEPLETPGEDVLHVQKMLDRCWSRTEGLEVEEEHEQKRRKSYVEDFDATAKEELVRPEMNMMNLVAKKHIAPVGHETVLGAGVLD